MKNRFFISTIWRCIENKALRKTEFEGFVVKNRGFRTFRIYGKFGNCSTLKLNFENREKLVPTLMVGLKFGMQG